MILKLIQIDLIWKEEEVSICNLRLLILDRLSEYGEPLRWAIVETETVESSLKKRKLKLEAIVAISSRSKSA